MTDERAPGSALGAESGPEGRGTGRRGAHVAALEHDLRRSATLRRMLYKLSLVFPSAVMLLLAFLGVYPLVVAPARSLIPTLISITGAGLSFASVTFSASRAIDGDEVRSLRLATAGAMLFRFALSMSVVLGLATASARLTEAFGEAIPIDLLLRGMMGAVCMAAIGSLYLAARTLVALLGPDLEDEAAQRLARLGTSGEGR